MGADLLLWYAELAPDKTVDWRGAGRAFNRLDESNLLEIWCQVNDDEAPADPEKRKNVIEEARGGIRRALRIVKAGARGRHRSFDTILTSTGSWLLVCGGPSWGDDPFEGFSDLAWLDWGCVLGAAGFEP